MNNCIIEKTTIWLNKEAKKVMGWDSIVTNNPVVYEEVTGMYVINNKDSIVKIHKTMVLSMTEIKKGVDFDKIEVKSKNGSSSVIISSDGITSHVENKKL